MGFPLGARRVLCEARMSDWTGTLASGRVGAHGRALEWPTGSARCHDPGAFRMGWHLGLETAAASTWTFIRSRRVPARVWAMKIRF